MEQKEFPECVKYCKLKNTMNINNSNYAWHGAYLTLAFIIMISAQENFTFVNLTMFVAPVFLDLLNVRFNGKILKNIKKIITFLYGILLFFSVSGNMNVVSLVEGNVKIQTILVTYSFSQNILILATGILTMLVVAILYYGTPCVKSILAKEFISSRDETKSKT